VWQGFARVWQGFAQVHKKALPSIPLDRATTKIQSNNSQKPLRQCDFNGKNTISF
jgi:hypothetical protein